MPHRYRETSLQCSRTTSTKLLHATLAGLGPWARSHNHDVSTATVIPATGANRREPAEVLDAVRQVHGEAFGLLVVVVVAPQAWNFWLLRGLRVIYARPERVS